MDLSAKASFVNGIIAGAGIVLSVMSIAFLRMVGPLEGKMGVTTTEIRIAIFLGFVISAIAVLYEIYRKKDNGKQNRIEDMFKQSMNKETVLDE